MPEVFHYIDPDAPPTVTGNQWGLAVADLDLAGALLAAVQKSKAKDQHRYGLIARDTPLRADDPLLIRVCGNSGGAVDYPTVFAHAQAMPL